MSSLCDESELEVLLLYEGKLVAALKKKDVMSLCQNLCERVVISKEVKDMFASLDHDNLKMELMVRYLLQHVYDAVKDNKLVLYSFLEVLGEFDRGVAGDLGRELSKYELAQSDVLVRDSRLCEEDVPKLTELLSSGSYKSEELGLSLGLHKNQIIQCQKGCSNMIALSNVLLEWIRCSKEPCTVNRLKKALASNTVALNNMASQLDQYFVDEIKGHVTERRHTNKEIQGIYCSDDTTVAIGKSTLLGFLTTSTNPVRHQWRENGQPLSDNEVYSGTHSAILYVSCVGVQIEGKYDCLVYSESGYSKRIGLRCGKINLTMSRSESTRQFLKIYSKMDEIPKDSWPPVTNTEFINLALITRNKRTNDDYDYAVQGDMDDIIAAKANVEYEEVFGKYESGTLLLVEGRPGSGKTILMHKVTRDWAIKRNVLLGAEIVVLVPLRLFFGEDVTLSSIFEKYIEGDSQRNKFIESAKERNGEGICFIIDGLDEYELNNDRSTLIYKLIHKHVLRLAMVIVASRPVGTASVRNEASVYERIEVLGFKNEQIMEYVESYFNDSKEIGSGLIKYLNSHINVLRMCYLPVHAAMICFLYGKRRDKIPQTETRIYETFTISTLLRKLMRDNKTHENKRHENISSLHCLTGDIKKYFNKICELAFDMTIHSKQAILQSQTQFPLSTPGSDKSSLGLVTIDSNAELFGMEDLYSFLHLTFQEYLAAFYLAGLEDDKEIICKTKERHNNLQMVWKFYCGMVQFKAHSLVLNYIMSNTDLDMNKIHCAFESQQHIVCDSVLELDKADTLSFKDHRLIPTDFLAISYVISTTSYIVTTLTFTDCSLDGEGVALFLEKMSSDHLENIKYLGYHNSNCTFAQLDSINVLLRKLTDLEVLDLENTELGVEDVKRLIGYTDTELPHLRILKIKLPLNHNSYSVRSTKLVHKYPKEKPSIDNDYFIFMLMEAFSNVICFNSTYRAIYCYNGTFQSFPQTSMQTSMEYIRSCSKLVLINCGITDDDLKLLVESMTIFTELCTLRLDFNRITGKGATLISSHLVKVKCTSLEVVSAVCNLIDDSGALAIAKALVGMSNLKILDLQGNPITDNGASALIKTVKDLSEGFQVYVTINNTLLNKSNLRFVKESLDLICKGHDKNSLCTAFKCCTYLQTLDLSGNSIGSDGAVALADVLKCCTNLKTLNLSGNYIGSDGAVALAEGLKCCTNLQTLNLMDNIIGLDGAEALAKVLKCCANLQTLNLRDNGIGSDGVVALAEGLECCANLQTLDLSYNSIGSDGAVALAGGLKCCTNLKTLNLSGNYIGSDGAVALAEGLKCCTNLQTLNLMDNIIGLDGAEALAKVLKCCANLQTLNLRDNGIGSDGVVALAEGLECCANLQTLDLSYNSIGSDGAVALAGGLKCCTNLKTLNLRKNRIGSDGVVALAKVLKCCANLQTLNLRDNGIGSDGVVALAEGLECCTNLQTLDLSYNNIGSDGAVALADGLKCCTNLQTLDLSYNSIGSDGVVALAKVLKCCANLLTLNLRDNGIGSDGVEALAERLKCCTNLQTLDLRYNSIGSDGAVALADGLKCYTNLQTLYLKPNSIGSDGAVALAEGLKCCTNLQTLDLSYNSIGSDGTVALAKVLKCCANLQTLNLSDNGIGSDCVVALAEGLKCCTNLQTLDLTYNNIGSDGAVALAEGLKCCTNLQTLDLSYNSIGSDGAVALAEGLKCCTNLQTLDLMSNSIGSDGAVALADGLKCCTNLQILHLSFNSIGSYGVVALAEGLKCCTNLQTLDLSYNSIGSDGAVALAEGLKCCTNLQTLYLMSNSIGSDGAVALAEGLKCCNNLQKLYLMSTRLGSYGSDGAVALAEGLKCCTNLQIS